MHRFSSSEGYKLYDDTLPSLRALQKMGIQTALLSNSDTRMRLVLESLGITNYLSPILLSEETGVEKPSQEMFAHLLNHKDTTAGLEPAECLHVGDELECDYHGADNAGIIPLLLRRSGELGDFEHKEATEVISGLDVVGGLGEVVTWIRRYNAK